MRDSYVSVFAGFLALIAACGGGDESGDPDAAAVEPDAGGGGADDARAPDPDAAVTDAASPDAGPPPCGELDFEDALGPVGPTSYLTGATTEVIGGVTFIAAGTDGVTNGGIDAVDVCPFTSDWLGLWSYGDGGTIRFPEPVAAVEFVGGVPTTDVPSTFEVYAGDEVVETFTIVGTEAATVTILLFEATDTLVFRNIGGPNQLVGLDDLRYTTGDCD